MSNFKYIQNISNGVGTIRVYSKIGNDYDKNGNVVSYGINGAAFADEMAYLQNNCQEIRIRYNSQGGSVLDGYAIYSSVVNCTVPTHSFIDGIAASTAGWCALAANKVSISDMGTLMVHGASGKPQEMVDVANGSIAKMLSNRTGMSIEETTALMGKETFYKAFNTKDRAELLEKKIVDEVYSTGKKVKIKNTESVNNMALIYNTILNPTKDMSKLNRLLGISNNADEMEQESAIEKLQNSLTSATAELTETKNKLKTLEDANAAREAAEKLALKNKATDFCAKMEKAGRLKKEKVDETILNMSKDQASFDFISNLFGDVPSSKDAAKIFDPTKVKNSGAGDRSDWDYNKWEKEDPDGLTAMYINNKADWDELYKTYKPGKK